MLQRRKAGVFRKMDIQKGIMKTTKERITLQYCLSKDCELMSLMGFNFWAPCNLKEVHELGHNTMMGWCPHHVPKDLPAGLYASN